MVGVLLAVSSVAAFFGAWWWPLDLLANFRPQYGVVLVSASVLLLAGRWRRTGLVVLVTGLLNVALVGILYLPRPQPTSEERFRVVSFNLQGSNERFDDVVRFLDRVDPDVVFLHEASRPWEERLATAPLPHRVVRTRSDDLIFGTLVLVGTGAEVEGFGFAEDEPRAVEVGLTLASGARVDLLGVHPLAPTTEDRTALRDAQLGFATGWAARGSGPRLVTGDFNSGPWSHAFQRLLRDGGMLDSQRGFGLQPSFPATGPLVLRVAIDHLVHSPELVVLDRRLGPALGSDHFPLVVDLAVARPG